ncbi:MAG: 30S ribosomal protein S1 [Spirochaetota bacterium]|nr:30S ribosomal protein S1 [Spirochaetota bacterium]
MSKKIVIVHKKENKKNPLINEGNQNLKTLHQEANGSMKQDNFEELYKKSLTNFNQMDIVNGKIASVQQDTVFVDIGHKSEGKININEFDEDIQVGDEVKVMIVNLEDEDGNIILSKKKADVLVSRELIDKSFKDATPIKGKVIKEVKGGYIVDIGGIESFLPGSQMDSRKGASSKDYIGKKFNFKVTKYDPTKDNIVLSRKVFVEEELENRKKSFLKQIKEGNKIKGKVKNIVDYGAFIELEDGIDGFVHIKDLSWGHIKNCETVLSVGDEIETKIIKIDSENMKISLGLKQLLEDPWVNFSTNHSINDIVEGEVTRYTDYGAFVKIVDGVEGLVHVRDLSWTKKINHPKEILKIGDRIQGMIMDLDNENRKLSLGFKQVLPNPWDDIEEKYPKGKKIRGKIVNITNFGVFISLEDDLVGLLRVGDLDWTKKITNVKEEKIFQKGKEIDVIVLSTDKKEKTISLGLKQLLENPWDIFKANHPKGSSIKGKITKITPSGVIVNLDDNIEGFLHISEINKKRDQQIEEIYKEGDEINALILKIESSKNKVSLSTKQYEKQLEQKTIKKYINENKEDDKVTIGDLINFNKNKS